MNNNQTLLYLNKFEASTDIIFLKEINKSIKLRFDDIEKGDLVSET